MKEIKVLEAIQDNKILSNSANKELYIVMMEDPTIKAKYRIYLAQRVDEKPATVNMVGWEITTINSEINAQLKEIKNYVDAVELAKKNGEELENLTIPWQKILRIKTLKFSVK